MECAVYRSTFSLNTNSFGLTNIKEPQHMPTFFFSKTENNNNEILKINATDF